MGVSENRGPFKGPIYIYIYMGSIMALGFRV